MKNIPRTLGANFHEVKQALEFNPLYKLTLTSKFEVP
jgi:hypothetical protein